MTTKNIILIGFMGTGKSTVGLVLARSLNWKFVDSDEEIVREAGMAIPDIFAKHGESYFRELETKVLERITATSDQVIATGGGAVLRETNRHLMQTGGFVVALSANRQTIIDRVRRDTNRPLLAGDLEDRVDKLLREREGAYNFAHLTIDTTGLAIEQIAASIRAHAI